MRLELRLAEELGTHLADGIKAVAFRMTRIKPYVAMNADIVMDFSGVRHANSSFVNGLLTALFEDHGEAFLRRITFRGCNDIVRVLVEGAIALGVDKYDARTKS